MGRTIRKPTSMKNGVEESGSYRLRCSVKTFKWVKKGFMGKASSLWANLSKIGGRESN